jgi:hypothetical protein
VNQQFDVRGFVYHSKIHKEKIQKDAKIIQILLFHIYMKLNHVSGDTPPTIRSPKLHWQPLVSHTWKTVGRVVVGHCQTQCA